MNCPVCVKEPMVVLELDGVEIDYCLSCKGIWLDAGELELLLESSTEKDRVLESFTSDLTCSEQKRRCPIGGKKMDKIRCGSDRSVTIDKCSVNHGLWFDRGELFTLIKMGSADEHTKVLTMLKDMFTNDLSKTQ